MRFLPAGDAALLVELGNEISEAVNSRVRALDATVSRAAIPGVIETIPAYCSLLVQYDPLEINYAQLEQLLAELAANSASAPAVEMPIKEVPTIYGGDYGPDLSDVAAAHNLAPEDVIAIHSGTVYTVYMLGFSPGFAYMGNVPDSIATPRLAAPRTRVPAGSVAIAAQQTGVYPQSTPGGWRILGRTNLTLFDPLRDPACFFQPGDRVRFVAVKTFEVSETSKVSQLIIAHGNAIEILAPGLLTTVQDLGRFGYQRYGVPIAGAMDSFALRAGNALVGNPADAAVLEITVVGPTLRFLTDALIAITGADLQPILNTPELESWMAPLWTAIYVRGGSLLEFGGRKEGCRAYLAIAGGIAVPPVMNSTSTYLTGGFGGLSGRALRTGDMPAAGETRVHLSGLAGRSLAIENRPRYLDDPIVRVILGPQNDYFTPEAIEQFLAEEFEVTITSDRMGLRLHGPPLTHKGAKEIVSCGIAPGAIQVPPNAQPIILTADRQTVGGYPVIATVIRSDLPLLAQCVPGQSRVRFKAVSMAEAQEIYRGSISKWKPEDVEPDAVAF